MTTFFLQFVLLNLIRPDKMPFGPISHYAPVGGLLAIVVKHTDATGIQERAIHTMAGGVVRTAVWVVVIVGGSGFLFARAEVH
jgi:hypothetical protein